VDEKIKKKEAKKSLLLVAGKHRGGKTPARESSEK
jgi:hypothetical protein